MREGGVWEREIERRGRSQGSYEGEFGVEFSELIDLRQPSPRFLSTLNVDVIS